MSSPLGKHRKVDHHGNDFSIKCILGHESKIAARKALEAAYILSREPKLNGKNEQLSITSDLMPFPSYCHL